MRVLRRVLLVAVLAGAIPAVALAGGAVKGTVITGAPPGRPVANAVVMIDGPTVTAPPGAPHVVVEQRNGMFVPPVVAVAVGTTVDFPNSDHVLHNVTATSRAKTFDLGMYDYGETKSVTFEVPGVVPVRCNVHPRMEAYVVVHANPWVAVTDAHGGYTIMGVSAGNHQARVWQETFPERSVPVMVVDGQVTALDVHLESPR